MSRATAVRGGGGASTLMRWIVEREQPVPLLVRSIYNWDPICSRVATELCANCSPTTAAAADSLGASRPHCRCAQTTCHAAVTAPNDQGECAHRLLFHSCALLLLVMHSIERWKNSEDWRQRASFSPLRTPSTFRLQYFARVAVKTCHQSLPPWLSHVHCMQPDGPSRPSYSIRHRSPADNTAWSQQLLTFVPDNDRMQPAIPAPLSCQEVPLRSDTACASHW